MCDERLLFAIETVPDQLVAAHHWIGRHAEIPERLERLLAIAGERAAGDPFCLHHRGEDDDPGGSRNLEVCVPVREALDAPGVSSRVIEGGVMLCATRRSPAGAAAGWGPLGWWREAAAHIHAHALDLEDMPLRVRFTPAAGGGPAVTVLQFGALLPRWLDRLAAGVEAAAGPAAREDVLDGAEEAGLGAAPDERAAWLAGALDRLADAVPDAEARARVLQGCAHRFPPLRIARMRALYQAEGLDAVLAAMNADTSDRGLSWYEDPRRSGRTILVAKNPADREGHAAARTDRERRAACCHCGLVKRTILGEREPHAEWCHCGAGWYAQLWEGILGRPVRVAVLESVLAGDERCRFAIHLPAGV